MFNDILKFVFFLFFVSLSPHPAQTMDDDSADPQTNPVKKIVVVGGGLAGLSAAYELRKQTLVNHIIDLYEGRDCLGGRVHTHYFNGNKQYYEEGATWIDQEHSHMRNFAKELGVPLISHGYGSKNTIVRWNGQEYPINELLDKFQDAHKELQAFCKPLNLDDQNSLALHSRSSLSPFTKALMTTCYQDETGKSIDNAPVSSLKFIAERLENFANLATLKNLNVPFKSYCLQAIDWWYSLYRYTVAGGASTLIEALHKKVKDAVWCNLNHKLTKITRKADRFHLSFETKESEKKEVIADYVIITLPFSTLRNVQIDDSIGLRENQKRAIRDLPYGTNAKVGIPLNRDLDDLILYLNLDNHHMAWSGGKNVLTLHMNSNEGKSLSPKNIPNSVHLLKQNFQKDDTGEIAQKNWFQDPYALGSYSTFKDDGNSIFNIPSTDYPGLQRFAEPIDNKLYFAGEHTDIAFSGFMEGALRSGQTVAQQLAKAVTRKVAQEH